MVLVENGSPLNERKRSYWRYTHFPLNHDYGMKGFAELLWGKNALRNLGGRWSLSRTHCFKGGLVGDFLRQSRLSELLKIPRYIYSYYSFSRSCWPAQEGVLSRRRLGLFGVTAFSRRHLRITQTLGLTGAGCKGDLLLHHHAPLFWAI